MKDRQNQKRSERTPVDTFVDAGAIAGLGLMWTSAEATGHRRSASGSLVTQARASEAAYHPKSVIDRAAPKSNKDTITGFF